MALAVILARFSRVACADDDDGFDENNDGYDDFDDSNDDDNDDGDDNDSDEDLGSVPGQVLWVSECLPPSSHLHWPQSEQVP